MQYIVKFTDEEWDYKLFYIYRDEAKPIIAKIQNTVSVTIFLCYYAKCIIGRDFVHFCETLLLSKFQNGFSTKKVFELKTK